MRWRRRTARGGIGSQDYDGRCFIIRTASGADPRSQVAMGGMLRAISRTVLLLDAAASTSMARVRHAAGGRLMRRGAQAPRLAVGLGLEAQRASTPSFVATRG